MPFISQKRREYLSLGMEPEVVGELTYLAYVQMIGLWRANRRWTTAHEIKKAVANGVMARDLGATPRHIRLSMADVVTAVQLAWEVFFVKEVMVYELEKEAEHGEI